jgi:AAA+ ATPase superfamily predicted ATPase
VSGAPNPYHYGTPATEEHFAGRHEELGALVSRLRNGINVVLVSPRRYGKTSLLLRAEQEVEGDRGAIVHVNLLRCRDVSVIASQLATRAFTVPGGQWHRAAQAIPAFLKRIRVTPAVTFDGDKPKFTFEARLAEADADGVVADVYRLLAESASKRPAAVVLDEFQAVADVAPHLPRLLKSLADQHPHVSLVLAGSKQHLMDALVSSPGAALYGMAERLALTSLPDEVMVAYLRERARKGGKPMNEAVARLVVALAGPVPNDIQRLAYEAFDAAVDRIDEPSAHAGLERAVAHEAATYAERYERLSPGQRRVVAAIAEAPPRQPSAAEFVGRTGLANASSVSKAIDVLANDEVVVSRDGLLTVSDPFFAAWLRAPA